MVHYLVAGAAEGRDPHPLFDARYYLSRNPDVQACRINPLLHYLEQGAAEGRDPHPFFDSSYYLKTYDDVATARVNPLVHYLEHGAEEGRDPHPFFSTSNYLKRNPHLLHTGMNPLVHYARIAFREDRATKSSFASVSAAESVDASTESPDAESYREMSMLIRGREEDRLRPVRVTPPPLFDFRNRDLTASELRIAFERFDEPQVSILIPVYNNLRFTLECLASILEYTNDCVYEVIVVDDGSSDGTERVVSNIPGIRYIRNNTNLGFIRSCNHGAEKARGKYLVLLNNDVQVTEGWLTALVKTWSQCENVGAVGPRTLFPDGRLQEAGCLVNLDVSSTMIGMLSDPRRPPYDRLREVEYCSACCLACRTDVFLASGGFDTELEPCYCEDIDFCFRLRERGLRIMCNPQATVVHHLSVTTAEVSHGFKHDCIVRNRAKIAARRGDEIVRLNRPRLIAFYEPRFDAVSKADSRRTAGIGADGAVLEDAVPDRSPSDTMAGERSPADVLERRYDLARQHGIYGFCFHYRHSHHNSPLEFSLPDLLNEVSGPTPFCLCWTIDDHEPAGWSAQKHERGPDDCFAMGDLPWAPEFFKCFDSLDYIRINGRPLLLVRGVNGLIDPRRTIDSWREKCRRADIGEIYLAFTVILPMAFNPSHPKRVGFDAAVQFPPYDLDMDTHAAPAAHLEFEARFLDYRSAVLKSLEQTAEGPLFRSVMTSFDDTPMNGRYGAVFLNSSPGAYQAWLEGAIRLTREECFGDERMIFINAWNDWARGACLEPDRRFGRAYLEATRSALKGDFVNGQREHYSRL